MNKLKWSESKKTFGKMLLICGPIAMPKYTLKSQKNGNKEQIELKIGKKMRKSLEVRAITMIFYTINKI